MGKIRYEQEKSKSKACDLNFLNVMMGSVMARPSWERWLWPD